MQVKVQVLNFEIYLIKHRWWREAGETLWSELFFVAEPRYVGDVKPHLHQLLSYTRFRRLRFLRLDCPELIVAKESVSLSRCLSLLQTVVASCPATLRKLTLGFEVIHDGWEAKAPEELVQIGAILVNFEEVDLKLNVIDLRTTKTFDKNSKIIIEAVLKALPEVGSKLKILTLYGDEVQDKVVVELGGLQQDALEGLRNAGVKVNIKARDNKTLLVMVPKKEKVAEKKKCPRKKKC